MPSSGNTVCFSLGPGSWTLSVYIPETATGSWGRSGSISRYGALELSVAGCPEAPCHDKRKKEVLPEALGSCGIHTAGRLGGLYGACAKKALVRPLQLHHGHTLYVNGGRTVYLCISDHLFCFAGSRLTPHLHISNACSTYPMSDLRGDLHPRRDSSRDNPALNHSRDCKPAAPVNALQARPH